MGVGVGRHVFQGKTSILWGVGVGFLRYRANVFLVPFDSLHLGSEHDRGSLGLTVLIQHLQDTSTGSPRGQSECTRHSKRAHARDGLQRRGLELLAQRVPGPSVKHKPPVVIPDSCPGLFLLNLHSI